MNAAPAVPQSFSHLFDIGAPPSRQPAPAVGLNASIWAPQPQPSDTTWSKAIDTISRLPDGGAYMRPEFHRATSHPASRQGEDVFGPVGLSGLDKKDVGTIGDGRRRTPPDFDPIVCSTLLFITSVYTDSVPACPAAATHPEPQLAGAAFSC